jgi:hypothetical protein
MKRVKHGYVSFVGVRVTEHVSQFNLTAADITTLHSVPITLIPSAGINKVLVLNYFTLQFIYNSIAFTGGGAINPVYHGAVGTNIASASVAAASITAAASSTNFCDAAAGPLALPVATGIDLYAATADFAAGNSTAVVTIGYTVIELS